ncbi:MAG: glycosyltransferase [Alistipes sp.]|nr:glycosyltransferase [Alistipes sp.]
MIRLSIVIATYNRATLLLDALKSVIRQSAPAQEWECVVVNNNSSDNTSECFAEFASGHPEYNLRIVDEPNQGLSYARNRGIRESVGEYIAIIDDDEHIAEDFVAAYIRLFDDVPEAVAAGGPIVARYPTGRPRWMSCYTERPIANTMYFGEEVREFPKGRVPGGGNMALRRSAIRRYGVFDTSLGYSGESLIGGEECDLFERLQIADAKYYYVPTAVMYHIIPREKLTKEYFARLSYNVGVSQLRRARLYRRVWRVRFIELSKWVATLLIALWYTITLQWRKGYYLILMRLNISRGLWSRNK